MTHSGNKYRVSLLNIPSKGMELMSDITLFHKVAVPLIPVIYVYTHTYIHPYTFSVLNTFQARCLPLEVTTMNANSKITMNANFTLFKLTSISKKLVKD